MKIKFRLRIVFSDASYLSVLYKTLNNSNIIHGYVNYNWKLSDYWQIMEFVPGRLRQNIFTRNVNSS